MSKTLSLEVSEIINAPRAKVFKAWTDPALIKLWFAPGSMTVGKVECDPRPGGRYLVEMIGEEGSPTAIGEYVEVVKDERLVFTWGWQGDEDEPTRVTVTLQDHDKGTRVMVLHERFTSAESRDRHAEGWKACLDKLVANVSAA